jgi:hypothetical protein
VGQLDFPAPVYTGDVFGVWSAATGSAICSENDLLGLASRAGIGPVPVAGQVLLHVSSVGGDHRRPGAGGTLRLVPWLLTRTLTIDRLGAESSRSVTLPRSCGWGSTPTTATATRAR